MRSSLRILILAVAVGLVAGALYARQSSDGPYKVLKTARVGGEGGWDYIYADVAGRRIYIPRNGSRAVPATDTMPARAAVPGRISVYNLDTLALIGEIPDTGGQGVAVDTKSGHGFSSSNPITMFDTKTLKVIKKIDPGTARPDGIYGDSSDGRIYIFSHPTKNATVIDAGTGNVVGTIDLGGTPEEAVGDGKGTLYVVMQDRPGGVAVVDEKAMKTVAHYPFGDNGGCNGLALDVKNHVLFAACSAVGPAPARGAGGPPPASQPQMVILSATDGKILTKLPLAGGSDGAVFNPATMEAFSTHGNGTLTIVKESSPTSFAVEENLNTMNGARTITLDRKTGHIYTMSQEFGPAMAPAMPGGRGRRGPAVPGSFTILEIGK